MDNIPDQINKTVIITGATSVLTKKNTTVLMAVRNLTKAEKMVNEKKLWDLSKQLTTIKY